jgi:hypothetical protein
MPDSFGVVMSDEPDVLTEDDLVLLRTIQRHYVLAAAWPCRDNRVPDPVRPAEPARAPAVTRVQVPSRQVNLTRE